MCANNIYPSLPTSPRKTSLAIRLLCPRIRYCPSCALYGGTKLNGAREVVSSEYNISQLFRYPDTHPIMGDQRCEFIDCETTLNRINL